MKKTRKKLKLKIKKEINERDMDESKTKLLEEIESRKEQLGKPAQETRPKQKEKVGNCVICDEPHNKSTRKPIKCLYCNFVACVACSKMYALNSENVHCMNPTCKKTWNTAFVQDSFPKTWFHNELKNKRTEILFEKEKAQLPATQPYVESILQRRRTEAHIAKMKEKLKELKNEIQRQERGLRYGGMEQIAERNKKFIRACPGNNCKGFLSTAWKCELCETWVCSKCHEIKKEKNDNSHTCDPNSVETAKMLAKDSKPCPSCASMIFKISGCDQMWCTQCKVAFSWRTGNIVSSGVVHNPHFFEWQRQHGKTQGRVPRNPLDIPCGGLPQLSTLRNNKDFLRYEGRILPVYQIVAEMTDYAIRRLRSGVTTGDNRDLRAEYMMGYISEDKLKKTIILRDRRKQKSIELIQIAQMFITTGSEVFQRMQESNNVLEQFKELVELIKYANNAFLDTSKRWNISRPYQIFVKDDKIVFETIGKKSITDFETGYSKLVSVVYNRTVKESIEQYSLFFTVGNFGYIVNSNRYRGTSYDEIKNEPWIKGKKYTKHKSLPIDLEKVYSVRHRFTWSTNHSRNVSKPSLLYRKTKGKEPVLSTKKAKELEIEQLGTTRKRVGKVARKMN